MRSMAFVPMFVACTADQPDCGSGMHLQDGACVADPTDETSTPVEVGNDVDLDRYPPVVIATTPVSGTVGLDPSTTRMEATFSKRMETTSYAWPEINGTAPDYSAATASFDDDRTGVLEGMILEPERGYQAWINDPYGTFSSFVDLDGQSALPYPIVFATGVAPALIRDHTAAVVGSEPVAGTAEVDPTLARLEVVFGEDMDEAYSGWTEDTAKTFPEIVTTGFSDPRTAWADVVLEPSTTYAIWLDGFADADGNPAATWLLTFRTAD